MSKEKGYDDISIILPVYNERNSIERVLIEWDKTLKQEKIKYKFIICEDGSTDGTTAFLKKIAHKYSLILNQKRIRRGYGGAVIDGITTSSTKYLLSIDSDGQCDPKDFVKFWNKRNKADIIIGWRTSRADAIQRKLFSKLFKTLFSFLFPTNIHDPSAPFVLYKRETVLPIIQYLKFLKEGFWWGFIGTAIKKGLSVKEIPINHRIRLSGETVVYKTNKIPSIAIRNIIGLIKLRFS